jgi:hypothetical protein
MNVALTRCRKGMVVVTDKRFLQGAGRSTLLGQLCQAWSQRRSTWIDWKATLSGDPVELPGLPLSQPLLPSSSIPPHGLPLRVTLDLRPSLPTQQQQQQQPRPLTPMPTQTRNDEQTQPRSHSTPPNMMPPRFDSETEFPSLQPQPQPSSTPTRSHGNRQGLQYSLAVRQGLLAGPAARWGDRPRQQQQQASAADTSARVAFGLSVPSGSSSRSRSRSDTGHATRQGTLTTDAKFPPLKITKR